MKLVVPTGSKWPKILEKIADFLAVTLTTAVISFILLVFFYYRGVQAINPICHYAMLEDGRKFAYESVFYYGFNNIPDFRLKDGSEITWRGSYTILPDARCEK